MSDKPKSKTVSPQNSKALVLAKPVSLVPSATTPRVGLIARIATVTKTSIQAPEKQLDSIGELKGRLVPRERSALAFPIKDGEEGRSQRQEIESYASLNFSVVHRYLRLDEHNDTYSVVRALLDELRFGLLRKKIELKFADLTNARNEKKGFFSRKEAVKQPLVVFDDDYDSNLPAIQGDGLEIERNKNRVSGSDHKFGFGAQAALLDTSGSKKEKIKEKDKETEREMKIGGPSVKGESNYNFTKRSESSDKIRKAGRRNSLTLSELQRMLFNGFDNVTSAESNFSICILLEECTPLMSQTEFLKFVHLLAACRHISLLIIAPQKDLSRPIRYVHVIGGTSDRSSASLRRIATACLAVVAVPIALLILLNWTHSRKPTTDRAQPLSSSENHPAPALPAPPPVSAAEVYPASLATIKTVRWSISTQPPGAKIFSAGHQLGITPWTKERPTTRGISRIIIQAPGYEDKTLMLDQGVNINIDVKLDPSKPSKKTKNLNRTSERKLP